ncbi:MAG: ribonuclease E [Candidatus Tokpelaia sp. JSC161]|jgi:ribonuclease E|nr:MAG: ribonuclease E [Candidatus Tokpelaia sp. JSC161]
MSNKMLIDASYQEETRVVVLCENRIQEFDFESEHKKQLKGNIYLAKVTRVEPSLQAAFVEYGGMKHGFLAFSEVHPDYYQIPVADRIALLEEEEQENENHDVFLTDKKASSLNQNPETNRNLSDEEGLESENNSTKEGVEEGAIELVDGIDDLLVRRVQQRNYRIQEVIKRRQILLVQVIKEARGNKGVALTTYLSLAGRYSVLMPNTARGGGISRKITNAGDRKRLREILQDLSVPMGMGIILRTAGANRTKTEIKRDYEYLIRVWDSVRTLTLNSIAPVLVHEEGSLIKRSIRDLYNKDIDQILVSGDKGYREAKDFMRMLMPSHAKVVQPYRETLPIFARNGIEAQLDRILQPEVILRSGGYLVLNQTEALVSIDVNSGRSIKEHSIEETAVRTNLEAAEEIARQLRLRDLAGLIVIDFIDMLEKRNIRSVEKKLKDCLKEDRARIQVGRMSHFGLLEMSRQRIRSSVLESITQPCPHCSATGYIRSESSIALYILRSIEEYLQSNYNYNIIVHTSVGMALYLLNNKRKALAHLEEQFHLSLSIKADIESGQHLLITKGSLVELTPENEEVGLNSSVKLAKNLDSFDKGCFLSKSNDEYKEQEPIESAESSQMENERKRGTRKPTGHTFDKEQPDKADSEEKSDSIEMKPLKKRKSKVLGQDKGRKKKKRVCSAEVESSGDGTKRKQRNLSSVTPVSAPLIEPVVTSSIWKGEEQSVKVKRAGWWQRKDLCED